MQYIIGAIFAVSAEHASRIFNEDRTVFVKYTNMNKLKKNSIIIFYVSKEKKLIGEGLVKNVEKMTPEDAWSKHSSNLFINEGEFNHYTSWSTIEKKSRTTPQIAVFVLKKIVKYKRSPLFQKFSPSGQYITSKEYDAIKRQSK